MTDEAISNVCVKGNVISSSLPGCLSSQSCQPPLDLDLPGTQHVLAPSPTKLHALALAQPARAPPRLLGKDAPLWGQMTPLQHRLAQHCLGVKCSSHAQQSNIVPSAIYHPEHQ